MAVVFVPHTHHGSHKSAEQIEQEQIAAHKALMKRKEAIIVMESTDFVTKSSMTTDEALIIKEWILADAKVYCMNAGVMTKAAPVAAVIQQRDQNIAQQKAQQAREGAILGYAVLIIIGAIGLCFIGDIFWTGLKSYFR